MNWLQVFAEFVLPIAVTLLLAVLVPAAHRLGALLAGKTTVETQIRIEQMLEALVIQGIHFAEEQARNALRSGGPRPDGPQKLELALAYVNERLAEAKVVDIAAQRLRDLIESKLHYERPELEEMAGERDAQPVPEPEAAVPPVPAASARPRLGVPPGVIGAFLLVALAGALAVGPGCKPLTPAQGAAIETSASVTCTLVETWCNPDVVLSAPARLCRLAADVCHGGELALAVLLPGLAEPQEGLAFTRRAAAALTVESLGPEELPMAYSEWGLWCSHVEGDDAATALCERVRQGNLDRAEVTIAIVPAAGAGAGD